MKNLKKLSASNKTVKFLSVILIIIVASLIIIKLLVINRDLIIKIFGKWREYFSNIIGALIGGAFTITGIYITIRYERKKEEENNRLQILPYLSYEYITQDDSEKLNEGLSLNICAKTHYNELSPDQYTRGYLIIKNIGLRSAVEVNILQVDFDDLKMYQYREIDAIEANSSKKIFISVTPPTKELLKNIQSGNMPIKILVGYSDLLDNYYEQTIDLYLGWATEIISDGNSIISESYSYGCGISNVSRPIVYKGRHIKYEKFKRINEFNNHHKNHKT